MRKLMLIVLSLLLLCAPALAEEQITLPDVMMSFTPVEGVCFTRESSASLFNRYGVSQRDILAWMEASGCYALMYSAETGSEITMFLHHSEQMRMEDMTEERVEYESEHLRQDYNDAGFDVHDISMHQSDVHSYMLIVASEPHEGYSLSMSITLQQGYQLDVQVIGDDEEAVVADELFALLDSIRITPAEGLTRIGADAVSIRLSLPEGMTMYADEAAAGIAASPEQPVGQLAGVAAPADGSWYVRWQVDESATGDMERLSNAGLRSLYEDRARRKKASGFAVTAKETYAEARQTYVHLSYTIPGTEGETWYAEEYYTKQSGWGVIITVCSQGEPVTEEALALVKEMIDAQLIRVEAE
ncbi:MAG: hypothetical protein IJ343_02275 [Clostridia bacterium]|nr:hypothetical protein [Clostridia bacterium]